MKTEILLIDDDILIHFINKRLLRGLHPEEDIYFFDCASLALDYLEQNKKRPDVSYVIFLDINMPEINGWQFMDKLKEIFSHLSFRIHMLTSSIDKKDQLKAKEYDYVHSYIVKPLDKYKLAEVLNSMPEKIGIQNRKQI